MYDWCDLITIQDSGQGLCGCNHGSMIPVSCKVALLQDILLRVNGSRIGIESGKISSDFIACVQLDAVHIAMSCTGDGQNLISIAEFFLRKSVFLTRRVFRQSLVRGDNS